MEQNDIIEVDPDTKEMLKMLVRPYAHSLSHAVELNSNKCGYSKHPVIGNHFQGPKQRFCAQIHTDIANQNFQVASLKPYIIYKL